MTRKLKAALRRQKRQTKQEIPQLAGMLGIELGGQRIVEVPQRNGFVYVKLRDNQNEIIQAFNNKVSPSYNLPVLLERQNNRYVVVAVNADRYQNNWTTFAPFLPRHGNTHSFDIENGGGGDIVWIQSRQFTPILVIPSGTLGANNVVVSGYALKDTNGAWKYVGNTGTQNLDPYRPTTGSQAVMALVYLDTVSGNPQILIGSGSYFSENITGTAQVLPYVPSITNLSHIPLAGVRLVTGTNGIGWDNIYDLRQFYYNVTGSGGGSSSVSVQDEGVPLGTVDKFNFVGGGVDVSVSGTTARVHITGSGGSGIANLTGTSIGLPNKVALTNNNGFLNTHPGLAWGITGSSLNKPFIEFGANVPGKVFNAGWMGYQLFDNDFDIVGAGTGSGDRWTRFYDNVRATHMQPGSLQIPTMLNTFVWLNATGTFVTANNALQKSANITGSDYMMGVDGLTDQSYLMPLTNVAGAVVYSDTLGTFTNSATVQATGTFSTCPWKDTVNNTTNSLPCPEGGLAFGLSVRISTTQPASGSLVITFMIEGVATALAVTIPAGSTQGTYSNTTNRVILTDNQSIRWDVRNNATAASAAITGITMGLSKRATA